MTAFIDLTNRLDSVKSSVREAEIASLQTTAAERRAAAAHRASCYVWASAALENYVRSRVTESLLALSGIGVAWQNLRESLLALLCDADFDRVRDLRKYELKWPARLQLLQTVNSSNIARVPLEIIPLDGKTLRPHHLEMIWGVFGIRGHWLPDPPQIYSRIIGELATSRNDLAHGHVDPVTFGRTKTLGDVEGLFRRIEDLVVHVEAGFDDYFRQRRYLR